MSENEKRQAPEWGNLPDCECFARPEKGVPSAGEAMAEMFAAEQLGRMYIAAKWLCDQKAHDYFTALMISAAVSANLATQVIGDENRAMDATASEALAILDRVIPYVRERLMNLDLDAENLRPN